ncbi:MAG: hypothetical protein R3324_02190, partial [Halobacteriales archaeon]|nr:hypothetical protein [Halobacteriales archaeon]
YVATLDLEIVQGRSFTEEDRTSGEPLALVNQAFARRHFASASYGARTGAGEAFRDSSREGAVCRSRGVGLGPVSAG